MLMPGGVGEPQNWVGDAAGVYSRFFRRATLKVNVGPSGWRSWPEKTLYGKGGPGKGVVKGGAGLPGKNIP